MPKDIRPTQNLVRKALFDILGQELDGEKVLELFAGSGALGLEALSRGAGNVTFVERESHHVEVILENIKRLKIEEANPQNKSKVQVLTQDAFASIKLFAKNEEKFDLVIADPPYEEELGKKALKHLGAYDILHPNSVVVIQHYKRQILPQQEGRIMLFREESYGATRLSFYKIIS